MEKKLNGSTIKVLICDDSAVNGVKMASELVNLGFYAYTRKNTGDAILRSILSDKPDAVISDITLSDTDAMTVIQRAKSILSKSPAFIILSEISNNFIERQVLQNGASYFLAKPFGVEELCKAINAVVFKGFDFEFNSDSYDVEIMATELIQKVGIPANIRGYRYIRTAIIECVENGNYLNSITKLLYPKVAEKHNTTPTKVERAIRHAIDSAWHNGDKENIYSYFGYKSETLRPTNSKFISLATDKISLILKNKKKSENSNEF